MASSSSLSLSQNWDYNVFPSFHGPDVRKGFLSHLLEKFKIKGIKSFIDNEITRGESIGPELKRAIRGSKIALVLLSKNYASSSWCLDELVEIMNKELGQTVMTIFYDVDPTHVKKQIKEFGKAFEETCKGKTEEKINTWRKALEGVATIAGYTLSNGVTEAAMVKNIATDISNMLNLATRSSDFDNLIGMEAHMERMKPLLRLDLDEVRMIGICGSPGIGKSTISRFLFDKFFHSFKLKSFMGNIKKSYPQLWGDEYSRQQKLQSQMLSDMLNQKDVKVHRLGVAKERLKDKKVLLVLDDVDQLEQLDALAGKAEWFGPGSRIIITTQDRRLLERHGINHIYKVEFPSTNEASQMFCMYAFGQNYPKDGFRELASKVADLASQLPLALRVMGSHFKEMSKQRWENALPTLKTRLHTKIETALKFSYDALCEDDKNLFLHIACYFNYEELEKVVGYLANCFKNVRHMLDVLAEKSLISMENSKIGMHSLLVELGREIVRKQSINDPGQCQFLVDSGEIFDSGEICEILTDEAEGGKNVIGIKAFLGWHVNISGRAFERMSNLQFLRLLGYGPYYAACNLSHLSPKLRILHWDYFPATCLPSNVNLKFLVELDMRNSKLEKLWEGIKRLPNLKWMNLSRSVNLKELPDLLTATNLKELNLSECSSLVELPSSIRYATSLQNLDLSFCTSLVELPSSIGNATSLQKLNLSSCKSLVELPSSIGNATSLKQLDLRGCTSLVELPSSIGNATSLPNLDLSFCISLVELPSSIGNVTSLQNLDLSQCTSLVELPSSIGNATSLQKLNLRYCTSLVQLPSSIENATSLQKLNLKYCTSLVKLPSSIGNATSLQKLNLSSCKSLVELPSSIGNATSLQKLNLSCCASLVELPSSIGNATSLEKLNLQNCTSLVELPSSIGNATSLEQLDLRGCTSLVELPSSIGNATSLPNLDLSFCISLVELPSSIGNVTSLQNLDLSQCTSLVELPSSIGNATSLQILNLRFCKSLVELPSSIGNATSLRKLDLYDCTSLVELPSSIGNATYLYELDLSYCTSLVELPSSIGNLTSLQDLDLSGCESLVELPSSIGNATSLQILNLSHCTSLVELPSSIGNATSLHELNLYDCTSLVELPSSIGNATSLQQLDLGFCKSLVELPSSIGNATNLQKLNLNCCASLVELPSSIGNATSLEELNLQNCTSLVELPSSIGNATSLQQLNLNFCRSLVEVPASIGNLHKLMDLTMKGISKLEVLPVNVNLKSLDKLVLSGCLSLKSFPEISQNIKSLDLNGTAIEVVPSFIWSCSRLEELDMSNCKNLKEFSHALDNITERVTKRQKVSPFAENCESLERLDCSFPIPYVSLNFANCFKLNKEARDLIIQTSTNQVTVLPGRDIPTYFTYRGNGGSLVVKLNEKPFCSTLIFKVCIMLVSKKNDDFEAGNGETVFVDCWIMEKQNQVYRLSVLPLTEHLYLFEIESDVTSNEFFFEIVSCSDEWVIKECGVFRCTKHHDSRANKSLLMRINRRQMGQQEEDKWVE